MEAIDVCNELYGKLETDDLSAVKVNSTGQRNNGDFE